MNAYPFKNRVGILVKNFMAAILDAISGFWDDCIKIQACHPNFSPGSVLDTYNGKIMGDTVAIRKWTSNSPAAPGLSQNINYTYDIVLKVI